MTSKAFELAKLGNVVSDGALSNRNLIINGKHAVNQRGQLPASMIAGYNCTDRWKTYTTVSVSNSLSTVTLPNGDTVSALKGVSDATTTGMIDFYQVIENTNYSAFADQTMTASCWIRSNSTNARLFIWGNSANIGSVTHSGNGQWEKLTVTFTLPSNPTQLEFYAAIGDNINLSAVSLAAGEYVEFTEAQLEVGDTATPFEHRSYGQELALCQRYFEKSLNQGSALGGSNQSGPYFSTTSDSGSNATFSIPYAVVKRANPTITVWDDSNTSGVWTYYRSGVNQTASGVNVHRGSNQAFNGYLSVGSATFVACTIYGNWAADAEL